MASRCAALGALVVLLLALVSCAAALDVVPLPYATDKYAVIDAETMTLHHDKHYAGYVSKYNAATANASSTSPVTAATPLPVALSLVGSIAPADLDAAVRNQGGGAWNHAMFWRTLAPPGSAESQYAASASADLKGAVDAAFGGAAGLRSALAKAGAGVFGSGWAFVCATAPYYPVVGRAAGPGAKAGAVAGTAGAGAAARGATLMPPPPPSLRVVSSPNQDSPLTGMAAGKGERCVPIMGLDVWEHAYYLKYRNLRPAYIDAVLGNATAPGAINWAVVSANYAAVAEAGAGSGGDGALLAAAGAIGQQ